MDSIHNLQWWHFSFFTYPACWFRYNYCRKEWTRGPSVSISFIITLNKKHQSLLLSTFTVQVSRRKSLGGKNNEKFQQQKLHAFTWNWQQDKPISLRKQGWHVFYCYDVLNVVAMATLTELLKDQGIFAVQNCLGKLVFLLLVHTIIEKMLLYWSLHIKPETIL